MRDFGNARYLMIIDIHVISVIGFVICSLNVTLLVMDEDPNQLIEAPEDDDINDLNDETFGNFVENCMHQSLILCL